LSKCYKDVINCSM